MDTETTVVIRKPSKKDKGYLKRQRRAIALDAQWNAAQNGEPITLALLDATVDFLLDYVQEPADRAAARAAIEDLSEDELESTFRAISDASQEPAVHP